MAFWVVLSLNGLAEFVCPACCKGSRLEGVYSAHLGTCTGYQRLLGGKTALLGPNWDVYLQSNIWYHVHPSCLVFIS
jgi:hypothetical protein